MKREKFPEQKKSKKKKRLYLRKTDKSPFVDPIIFFAIH